MSVNSKPATEPTSGSRSQKPKRFQPAKGMGQDITKSLPELRVEHKEMGQLLSPETLKQLARRCHAEDQRRRKLTCETFFWLAVLACGPGGTISLQGVLTYFLVAHLMAGLGGVAASLSKEAVSENFRERPWQFFEAVLLYLLRRYTDWWQQLAGQPQGLVVEQMQVLLIDATIMRVANKLFGLYPARATGKRKQWAGVKLHMSLGLFRSVPTLLALTPEKHNEQKIDFLRPAGEAVLYIFDLGYWAYHLFDTIIENGQHFLSRLRADCNPPILAVTSGDPQWVGKRLKEIVLTGEQVDLVVRLRGSHPTHPQMHHDVRLIGQWRPLEQVWHLYVTTLLDTISFPVDLLIDLYRLRWQIEILFRNLKSVLRIANFVSITDNGIRIQIYATLIHYVLTHLLILKAMQITGRKLEDFSIPYCLEAVQQVLRQVGHLVIKDQVPPWQKLETCLLKAVIAKGLRPNRKRQPLITHVNTTLLYTFSEFYLGP